MKLHERMAEKFHERGSGIGLGLDGSPSPSPRSDSEHVPASPAEVEGAPDIGLPSDWGLPPSFPSIRKVQALAALDALEWDRRFSVLCMPTGTGKTFTYMLLAQMLEAERVCALTATKPLTRQIVRDFGEMGLVEVKGRNSFRCVTGREVVSDVRTGDERFATCEDGDRVKCPHRDPRRRDLYKCPYRLHLEEAEGSRFVVTNYHYWVTVNQYRWDEKKNQNPLGKFDLLVLDEAHDLVGILSEFAKIRLSGEDVPERVEDGCEDWDVWGRECESRYGEVEDELDPLVLARDILRDVRDPTEDQSLELAKLESGIERLESVLSNLRTIVSIAGGDRDNWIIDWDKSSKRRVEFNPVDLTGWTERYLFAQVPRILVVSATVRAKTLEMLGVKEEDYWFREYPSPFDPRKVPVIHVPTIRVDRRTEKDPYSRMTWMSTIDQIVGPRCEDRKGIIHTVSYKRARYIYESSRHRRWMMMVEQGHVRQAVEFFKTRRDPVTLLSPALTTGYDFPLDECEYQIVTKIPFPDLSSMSKVMKERNRRDPDYTTYLTIQDLVQMCGRGARTTEDLCETFIIDDHYSWIVWRNRQLVPFWFFRFLFKQAEPPQPKPSLLRRLSHG